VGALDKALKRSTAADTNGIVIPQGYDPAQDNWYEVGIRKVASSPDEYALNNLMWGRTSGGVYVPVQVDANGVISTQLTGSILEYAKGGTEIPTEAKRQGTLAAATEEVVLDTTTPIVIDNLLFSSDATTAELYIQRYDNTGALKDLQRVSTNGVSFASNWSMALFEAIGAGSKLGPFIISLISAGTYVVSLDPAKSIFCPFGAKIRVKNTDGSNSINAAVVVGYREVDL